MEPIFWISYAVLFVAVLAEGVLLYLLLNEIGKIYLADSRSFVRDGVPTGKRLPDLDVTAPPDRWQLRDLLSGAPYTFVLVAQPDCPHCREAATALGRLERQSGKIQLVVLVDGDDLTPYASTSAVAVARVGSDDVRRRLRVRATPFAFLVDQFGTVQAKDVVNDYADVRLLIERSPSATVAELASELELEEDVDEDAPPLSEFLKEVPGRARGLDTEAAAVAARGQPPEDGGINSG